MKRNWPVVVGTAWFGPKRVGWGLSPKTWQGWLVLGVFLAGFVISLSVWHEVVAAIACLAALGVVMFLTSDRPGGSLGGRDGRR